MAIVQVTPYDKDVRLLQAENCKGWDKWIHKLSEEKDYRNAAKSKFQKQLALVDTVVHGKEKIQELQWPDKTCEACVDRGDDDFDPIHFMESVRT